MKWDAAQATDKSGLYRACLTRTKPATNDTRDGFGDYPQTYVDHYPASYFESYRKAQSFYRKQFGLRFGGACGAWLEKSNG